MDKNNTINTPRFLQLIDLGYLLEGAKNIDQQFDLMMSESGNDEDKILNINTTRQVILRAIFISAFSILEQNLDEIVKMSSDKKSINIKPNDLKDKGIKRSITYAKKVLNLELDIQKTHWNTAFNLQDVRNHLVHFGPCFLMTTEHTKKCEKFSKLPYLSINESINFSVENIENICNVFIKCIGDFTDIKTTQPQHQSHS